MVELEPDEGEEMGRMDITFRPLIPREDIYFCLEGKRLNVIKDGRRRAYASEYVSQGMQRFITGKYAKAVLHGGMAGFVLDGDIKNAIANVAANIKKHHRTLGMKPPGEFLLSTIMTTDNRVRETNHRRKGECFRIHHLFLATG